MKLFSLFLLISIALILVFSVRVFACACCAEPGTYTMDTKKPEKYELAELKKIRFAAANSFITGAGEDNVLGINFG